MTQIKGPILIGFIVSSAFVWGYKKEEITAYFNESSLEMSAAPESEPPKAAPPAARTPAPISSPARAFPTSRPAALPSPNLQAPRRAPGVAPSPRPRTVSNANPTPTPFGFGSGRSQGEDNPYVKFLRESSGRNKPPPPRKDGNLADTMDSITPGASKDKQHIRRNAYFEKLSQQLKELRGEQVNPAQEIPAPPASEPDQLTEEEEEVLIDEQLEEEILDDTGVPLESEDGFLEQQGEEEFIDDGEFVE